MKVVRQLKRNGGSLEALNLGIKLDMQIIHRLSLNILLLIIFYSAFYTVQYILYNSYDDMVLKLILFKLRAF